MLHGSRTSSREGLTEGNVEPSAPACLLCISVPAQNQEPLCPPSPWLDVGQTSWLPAAQERMLMLHIEHLHLVPRQKQRPAKSLLQGQDALRQFLVQLCCCRTPGPGVIVAPRPAQSLLLSFLVASAPTPEYCALHFHARALSSRAAVLPPHCCCGSG